MVLSNKKLKQKLRAELSQSLASSSSVSDASGPADQSQSFRQLLVGATHKPILSKREKRRKSIPLDSNSNGKAVKERKKSILDSVGGGVNEDTGGDKKKKTKNEKKRKRWADGDNDDVEIVEEAGGIEKKDEGKLSEEKKNKKKKKRKKKQKKAQENKVEENDGSDKGTEVVMGENGRQGAVQAVDNCNSQDSVVVPNKVYVGGIPYYSTEDDIRSFFDHCGTITEVDCMTFPETGKFRGIAILTFMTEAAAKRAITLHGADMGGFFLKVLPYKSTRTATKAPGYSPPVIQGYNRIYVGNLSWDMMEEHLRKLFSDCNISSIRFGEDKVTGEFKGYAHVDFSDNLSLEKALKLDQSIVLERPVRISRAVAAKQRVVSSSGSKSEQKSEPIFASEPKSEPILASEDVVVEDKNYDQTVNTSYNNGAVSSGKMRRRTCYECGERGHISSACPKKPQTLGESTS